MHTYIYMIYAYVYITNIQIDTKIHNNSIIVFYDIIHASMIDSLQQMNKSQEIGIQIIYNIHETHGCTSRVHVWVAKSVLCAWCTFAPAAIDWSF